MQFWSHLFGCPRGKMWAEVSETRMCDEKTEDVSLEPAGPQWRNGLAWAGWAGQPHPWKWSMLVIDFTAPSTTTTIDISSSASSSSLSSLLRHHHQVAKANWPPADFPAVSFSVFVVIYNRQLGTLIRSNNILKLWLPTGMSDLSWSFCKMKSPFKK